MTINSFISKLARYSSSLYSRQWEQWEILTIAGIALALILLVIITRLKKKIRTRHIYHYTPVIGVRLAHPKARY